MYFSWPLCFCVYTFIIPVQCMYMIAVIKLVCAHILHFLCVVYVCMYVAVAVLLESVAVWM